MVILVVASYNYLLKPIIDRINEVVEGHNVEILYLDAPEIAFRHSYNLELKKVHIPDFPWIKSESDKNTYIQKIYRVFRLGKLGRSYRDHILEIVASVNPTMIISSSDNSLVLSLLKGSVFERRIYIVQPSLVNKIKHPLSIRVAFLRNRLWNIFFRVKLFDENSNWGQRLKYANFLLWTDRDKDNFAMNKPHVMFCGDFFMKKYSWSQKSEENSVLILYPSFDDENYQVLEKYVKAMNSVIDNFPYFEFYGKLHPRSEKFSHLESTLSPRLRLVQDLNAIERKPKFVISNYSAELLHLRREIENIIIFDKGNFKLTNNYWFDSTFFHFANSVIDIVNFINYKPHKVNTDIRDKFFRCNKFERFIVKMESN